MNGAVVLRQNLAAKNGLVHEVDRVLFPPTVGDLVQTLQVAHSQAPMMLNAHLQHVLYCNRKEM